MSSTVAEYEPTAGTSRVEELGTARCLVDRLGLESGRLGVILGTESSRANASILVRLLCRWSSHGDNLLSPKHNGCEFLRDFCIPKVGGLRVSRSVLV